jgi:HTH-type transcriptional regulator/antitoxin HigA
MPEPSVASVAGHWAELAKTVSVPHTAVEYERLVAFLDRLTDEVGENETHELASLMELISVLIERYEDEHVPELNNRQHQ